MWYAMPGLVKCQSFNSFFYIWIRLKIRFFGWERGCCTILTRGMPQLFDMNSSIPPLINLAELLDKFIAFSPIRASMSSFSHY